MNKLDKIIYDNLDNVSLLDIDKLDKFIKIYKKQIKHDNHRIYFLCLLNSDFNIDINLNYQIHRISKQLTNSPNKLTISITKTLLKQLNIYLLFRIIVFKDYVFSNINRLAYKTIIKSIITDTYLSFSNIYNIKGVIVYRQYLNNLLRYYILKRIYYVMLDKYFDENFI